MGRCTRRCTILWLCWGRCTRRCTKVSLSRSLSLLLLSKHHQNIQKEYLRVFQSAFYDTIVEHHRILKIRLQASHGLKAKLLGCENREKENFPNDSVRLGWGAGARGGAGARARGAQHRSDAHARDLRALQSSSLPLKRYARPCACAFAPRTGAHQHCGRACPRAAAVRCVPLTVW